MRIPKAAKVALIEEPVPASEQASGSRGRNPELEVVLGARIRAARIAAHMSQTELGVTVSISYQQVQKYEMGKDRVAASTLQGIAAALGVHPGSFFDDEMVIPTGSLKEMREAQRIGERVQRVRDPAVFKRLMAMVDILAEGCASVEQPTATSDETP